MKLKQLIEDTSWDDIKSSLIKIYKVSENNLEAYFNVYLKLISIESIETDMRICIDWIEPDGKSIEEGYWDIYGKNGTLRKDTCDADLFPKAGEEYLNSEVTWGIEFNKWEEWLGMEIDEETSNNINLMKADIIAHCFWEMTFIGYEEEEIQENLQNLQTMVDNIKNFSEEEIKNNCISFEEMEDKIDEILKKLDEDDEND